jgi:ABC-type branched-subunit amino acid transport system ATPase component
MGAMIEFELIKILNRYDRIIFEFIEKINRQGTSILLIEQNVFHSLKISDRGYVLENGEIALSGVRQRLLENPYMKLRQNGTVS